MGIDLQYVDIVKRNLSDESTKSANCNQDGDRCVVAASVQPAQKENGMVTPPKSPEKEKASAKAPASPVPQKEGDAIKKVPESDDKELDINFNKVSLSDKSEFTPLAIEKTCVFPFFLPIRLCGKLIGKNGWSRRDIKEKTGVDVHVLKEICVVNDEECQLVHLIGPEKTMQKAIQMVRSKFPVRKYPQVRLDIARQPIVPRQIYLPETQILVQISCVTNPSLIYVRQPEHWSYCSYDSFQTNMTAHYLENLCPEVKDPLPGDIYVALGPQCCRVNVLEVPNEEEVLVRYLDLGGIFIIPIDCLRPIKEEFLHAPFQATECAVAGIYENGPGWSNAAYNYLLSWSHQIIYGMVSYGGSIPCIQLFGKLANGALISINDQMILITQAENAQVLAPEMPVEMPPQEEANGEEAVQEIEAVETTVQEIEAVETTVQEIEACAETTVQEAEATQNTTEEVTISQKEEATETTSKGEDATSQNADSAETTSEKEDTSSQAQDTATTTTTDSSNDA